MTAIVSCLMSVLLLMAIASSPAGAATVRRDIKGIELGSSLEKLQGKFEGQCAPDQDPASPNTVACGKKVALYYSEFEIGLTSDGLADRIKYTFCSTQKFADIAQDVMAAYRAEKPEIDEFNATVDLDPATKLELRALGACTEDNARRYNLVIVGQDLIDADVQKQKSQQSEINQMPKF